MDMLYDDQQFDLRVFVEVKYDSDRRKSVSQIAAVLYDVANGEEISSFSQTIRGDESVTSEKAHDFPEALANLKKFCAHYPVWTFDNGQEIIEQNCTHCSIYFPFHAPFIRVRSLLRSWKIDPNDYSSDTLHQAAGLKLESQGEDALHGARSIAATVSYFENHAV